MIPNVRGMKKEDAIKLLKAQKLTAELDNNESFIIEMSPKPGFTVKEGSKVIFTQVVIVVIIKIWSYQTLKVIIKKELLNF